MRGDCDYRRSMRDAQCRPRWPAAPALLCLVWCARAAAASSLAPLPAQPPDVPWPTTGWPSGPPPASVAGPALEELLRVVDGPRPLLGETRAVLVIQRGRIVVERYMAGFGPDTRLVSWSMAKSITHALLGIAVRDGLVDLDRPMGHPRWPAGDPRAAVTWRQWVNMVDGIDYHEIGVVDPSKNDAAKMLFGEGRLDVAGWAATLPLVHPPGTHWNYNTAGLNLLADGLGRVLAPGATAAARRQRVAEVLTRELFAPLGMTSAQPEFDAAGTFIGGSLVYATARDYAKFGLLYLRDGMWQGRQLLPRGWVDFARTKTPAPNCDTYGAGWWVTPAAGDGKPGRALTPKGPRDLFSAEGHEGQVIAVVPSKDLIVVRLGRLDDNSGWHSLGDWVQALVALFPDVAPQP
jgi:CubicO group peptidase (beta-lactamase class C family)